jgi:DNA modification methylase
VSGLNGPPEHSIESIEVAAVVLPDRQPRRHSMTKIRKLAASIADAGFFNPILVDEEHRLIAGGARLQAAERLGMTSVPAIVLRGLSEAQRRRLALADNRLGEEAVWDDEALQAELRELYELDYENIGLAGWDAPDLDLILTPRPLSLDDEVEDLPEPPEKPVSCVGDKWICGDHVVVCGDARDPNVVELALGGKLADVVFIDPPYGISIARDISQRGSRRRHADFVMASGELGADDLLTFFEQSLAQLKSHSREGAVAFVCIDWRHLGQMLKAAAGSYGTLLNLAVWVKTNPGLGLFYRSQHELVLVLRNGAAPHRNNIALGTKRRFRTNVWTYAGNTANTKARKEELASHPTVKPTAMIVDALEDVSAPGDLVLDTFGGSGSTLIAAHAVKRRAALVELDPKYVDVILSRVTRATGLVPVHAETGETFEAVSAQRAGAQNVTFPEWAKRPA